MDFIYSLWRDVAVVQIAICLLWISFWSLWLLRGNKQRQHSCLNASRYTLQQDTYRNGLMHELSIKQAYPMLWALLYCCLVKMSTPMLSSIWLEYAIRIGNWQRKKIVLFKTKVRVTWIFAEIISWRPQWLLIFRFIIVETILHDNVALITKQGKKTNTLMTFRITEFDQHNWMITGRLWNESSSGHKKHVFWSLNPDT